MTLRVLLVDDHAIVREGYRALLDKQADLRVVGEAADGETAYRLCFDDPPDIVVMDLSLPGASGIATIARLRRRHPRLRIVVLSMHEDCIFAMQALDAGADGYLTKSAPPALLVQALRDVRDGARPLSPGIAQALALRRLEHDSLAALTPREFSVLRALVDGSPPAAIAEHLHLSRKTVDNVHYAIKRKLGVDSDIALVRLVLRLSGGAGS